MGRSVRLYGMLCLCCLVAGCMAVLEPDDVRRARIQGFEERLFAGPFFTLYGLYRPAQAGRSEVLRVYVEGDGRAWLSRGRAAEDPTPRNPAALRLATADPHLGDAVLYLARPCQYVRGKDRRNCAARWWTNARLAPEIVVALNHAVDEAKAQSRARQVALVGFSGGGGAAVLMAAQRQDVMFVGTVAGNLDTDAWTRLHGVSPLAGSLNPVEAAPVLARMPQRHLSSRYDAVMPPEISAGFCRKSGRPETCVVVDGVEHNGAWEHVWDYTFTR